MKLLVLRQRHIAKYNTNKWRRTINATYRSWTNFAVIQHDFVTLPPSQILGIHDLADNGPRMIQATYLNISFCNEFMFWSTSYYLRWCRWCENTILRRFQISSSISRRPLHAGITNCRHFPPLMSSRINTNLGWNIADDSPRVMAYKIALLPDRTRRIRYFCFFQNLNTKIPSSKVKKRVCKCWDQTFYHFDSSWAQVSGKTCGHVTLTRARYRSKPARTAYPEQHLHVLIRRKRKIISSIQTDHDSWKLLFLTGWKETRTSP